MALTIKWSKRAASSFHETVQYIEYQWSENSAKKFISRVYRFLTILKENPKIGKIEIEEKGIRGFVISRQISVLYRIKDNTIILLMFFDNRQHPLKKTL